MKPILLKIKGLNSFLDEQTIEFYKLTEKGLFGIFGPTGSGKSSILDAITMALYGKVTRDNKGFINTETDRLEVSYRFSIGIDENKKEYICDRCVKRDKKGAYKTTLARICEVDGENIEVLAEGSVNVKNSVESIVGLSVDDFTRSVVLPQGKFGEFLKLTGLERRGMLERIFKLERYGKGLREKIKKIKDEEEKLLIGLNGQIDRYNDISIEKVNNLKEELKFLQIKEQELKEKKEEIDKIYEEHKNLWYLKKELDGYIKQYEKLIEKAPTIKQQRIKFEYGKNAINIKPFIDEANDTQKNIKLNESNLKDKNELLIEIAKKLQEIKRQYEIALKDQREKTPELIKKSTELTRAIDINKRVEEVKKERTNLRIKYDRVDKEIKSLEETLLNITKYKESLTKELEENEININNKTISPEYRNDLYKAYEKYCKYKDFNNNMIVLNEKKNTVYENIEVNKQEFSKMSDKKLNLDNSIKQLIEKITVVENECPGDGNVLLMINEEVNLLKEKRNKTLKNLEIKEELNKKYEKIICKKKELQSKFDVLKLDYENKLQELENLQQEFEKKSNENIAYMLAKELEDGKPCPVCGCIHHMKKANLVDNNILDVLKEKIKSLETQCKNLSEEVNAQHINIATLDRDKQHLEEELQMVNDELKDMDIDKLEYELKDKTNHFTNLKEKIDKWNKELDNLKKNLESKKEEKLDVDKAYISLQEKIASSETNLKSINDDFKDINEQSSKIFEEYKFIMENLKLKNIEQEIDKIKNWDEEIVKIKKIEKINREKLNKFNIERENLQKDLAKLESERAKITQSGIEKKNFIEEFSQELKNICGENNPEESILQVKKEIERINTLEKTLGEELELSKNKQNSCEKEKVTIENNLKTLKDIWKVQSNNLNSKLNEYGFKDKNEAISYFISKERIDELEKILNQYDDSKIKLEHNIKTLENKMAGKDITENQWQESNENRISIQKNLNECIELKGQKIKELSDMEKNLKQVQELLKLRSEYEHKYSLCEELDNLVKGNKFVEFVAMHELRYIAIEASKRLKSITRGRYALEIDTDGNFVMRDDFNGGTRRQTSTLSGGETFLTSLSLALALSSQIQLKGSAPLEFFFLDEGFGTLDSGLLEVVMTSLEKLRNEKLSVGIISHVDELKNRVPVKLIVTPANQGMNGSLINIEYS